ncbi:hypothetical protein DICPUDRAFT_99434 [Dictyostelium purpureum]|uniref:Uncharacterized protein n=1 Tax=Dictyostelium purpureum TaxID=5786 RepID=F0ZZ61_DICPU|nr:uncharacterized protein DICPUDRAFT_99434 [Dictyostelium purpureum]EGC30769.1 hypothetical protein DICPUDRAFT_99434 [Dictyostelium purpureum]|eukprot:XP_003292709.1 hypothetical protein DICPUDRAFT_99434 [Dictyostelium purpureum]
MGPFYTLLTLIIIFFKQHKEVLELIRDLYESHSLYMFFQLLVLYGGGDDNLMNHFVLHDPEPIFQSKIFPFLSNYKYKPTEVFVFQCIVIKPLFTFLSILCIKHHCYGSSLLHLKTIYPYKTIFISISLSLALSAIMLFIKYSYHELIAYKPILKFLSIKIVLGVFFYQNVVFSFITVSNEDLVDLIKNQLIIFELFLVSILHIYSYPYEFYRVLSMVDPLLYKIKKNSFINNIINTINQNDVIIETYQSLKSSYKTTNNNNNQNDQFYDFDIGSTEMEEYLPSGSVINDGASIIENNGKDNTF